MRSKELGSWFGAAVCAIVAVAPLNAQSLTGTTVRGVVTEQDGAPVFDASVTLVSTNAGFSRQTRTTRAGDFEYRFTAPGVYDLLIEKVGYHPLRIRGIVVSATGSLEVSAAVAAAETGTIEPREIRYDSPAGSTLGAGRHSMPRFLLNGVPSAGRELTSLARFATTADPDLSVEGLPGRWTGVRLDGFQVAPALYPDHPGAGAVEHMPVAWIRHAELVEHAVDVEWGGTAAGHMSAATVQGTRDISGTIFGSWSGDALVWSRYFDPHGAPHSAMHGGIIAGGPVIRDTAAFVIGVQAWRLGHPQAPTWPEASWTDAVANAVREAGLDPSSYLAPRLARDEALAAFGRVDWQVGPGHALTARVAWADRRGDPTSQGLQPAPGMSTRASELSAGISLDSDLGPRFAQQFMIGFQRSARESLPDEEHPELAGYPATRLIGAGVAFGVPPTGVAEVQRASLYAKQVTHFFAGPHHLKLGFEADIASHAWRYAYGANGERLFSDATALAESAGAEVRRAGSVPRAEWTAPYLAFFAQDAWRAAPGLEVTAGLRLDIEALPRGDVRSSSEWLERTGIDSRDVPGQVVNWSPRFGALWDVGDKGQWIVHAGAAVHQGRVDADVLGELLSGRGSWTVQRSVGNLGGSGPVATISGTRLTVLGPEFSGPRSVRAGAGIARRLGSVATISVSGAFRRTSFLPRRRDLNLLHVEMARDPYGRPIYGRLVKFGGLIVAEPGSNRRFEDFDVVAAVEADGRSDYLGWTFALEAAPTPNLEILTAFTLSRTTDDWLGGGAGGWDRQLPPFPRTTDVDWERGTSDYDAPHRFLLAANVRLPLPIEMTVGGAYTYRSGRPFTPGFRDGVDMNGDGSGLNDPAFIDDGVPGAAELIHRWDCLRDQVGLFAERNSCRGPAIHGLDARFAATLAGFGRYRASLVLDAVNLLESATTRPDHALYLVDPDAELSYDVANRRVTVPLVANPGFGEPLARGSTGRVLRIGIEIGY